MTINGLFFFKKIMLSPGSASSTIEALNILDITAGTHFDLKLLEIFHKVILIEPIIPEQ